MSRGGWALLIGVILIVAAGGIFAYSTLGFLRTFIPEQDTLQPGEYLNTTLQMQEGQILTYMVSITNYTSGDELTVHILDADGMERDPATVTQGDLTSTFAATRSGAHTLVIQNSGLEAVTIIYFAGQVDVSAALLLAASIFLGFVGLIVLIVGIVLLVLDRRK